MHPKQRVVQGVDALGLVIGRRLRYPICITIIIVINMINNIFITNIIRCVIHLQVADLLGQSLVRHIQVADLLGQSLVRHLQLFDLRLLVVVVPGAEKTMSCLFFAEFCLCGTE